MNALRPGSVSEMRARQRIRVFQENGCGRSKIAGIRQYGADIIRLETVNITETLPPVIDDSSALLPDALDADLVLDFLRHPDLSADLAARCAVAGIPVVAPGRKWPEAVTPPT